MDKKIKWGRRRSRPGEQNYVLPNVLEKLYLGRIREPDNRFQDEEVSSRKRKCVGNQIPVEKDLGDPDLPIYPPAIVPNQEDQVGNGLKVEEITIEEEEYIQSEWAVNTIEDHESNGGDSDSSCSVVYLGTAEIEAECRKCELMLEIFETNAVKEETQSINEEEEVIIHSENAPQAIIEHEPEKYEQVRDRLLNGLPTEFKRDTRLSASLNDLDPGIYKKLVLFLCNQTEVHKFKKAFPESDLIQSKKIGEGTYGEVFTIQRGNKCNVLKIIPVAGIVQMNGGPQRDFKEIIEEMVISKAVSDLRNGTQYRTENYVELLKCWCVQGRYPETLLKLWADFKKVKGSENRNPRILNASQAYLIFEYALCGTPLEDWEFDSPYQIISTFHQVTYAMAVAERSLQFEHRDLHWSNVLMEKTDSKYIEFLLGDGPVCVETYGVKATIIDFSLSRMRIPVEGYDGDTILFSNLAEDPILFKGSGDIQFDVYRQMKDIVQNKWMLFKPLTNVLWLEYILKKLLCLLRKTDRNISDKVTVVAILSVYLQKILACPSAEKVTNLF